jgi:hypothetical protein
MFCTKCGTPNAADAVRCARCGEAMQATSPAAPTQCIPNYLVHAILVTLFCCAPLGIVAVIYAAQVNGKVQAGDYTGAVNYSRNAKLWCWLAFGIGLLFIIFWIGMQVLVVILPKIHSFHRG